MSYLSLSLSLCVSFSVVNMNAYEFSIVLTKSLKYLLSVFLSLINCNESNENLNTFKILILIILVAQALFEPFKNDLELHMQVQMQKRESTNLSASSYCGGINWEMCLNRNFFSSLLYSKMQFRSIAPVLCQ